MGQLSLSAWGTLLVLGALFGGPASAQNCTAYCRSDQIQVVPGSRLTVEVINQAGVVVQVEQVPMVAPIALQPGGTTTLGFGWGTTPNLSMVFWTAADQPIRAYLFRPAQDVLRLEIWEHISEPSDRSLHIQNDGRVLMD